MNNTLRKAVTARDVPAVRAEIIRLITDGAGNRRSLESVSYALGAMPDIFVDDNGSMRGITVADNSPVLRDTLRRELETNFSREKMSLYADLCVRAEADRKAHCPETGADGEAEAEAYEMQALENEKEAAPADSAPEDSKPEATSADATGAVPARHPGARRFGWGVLAAGAVCAIVGLCIALKWLTGFGIGIMLIGTMVLYLDIQKRAGA